MRQILRLSKITVPLCTALPHLERETWLLAINLSIRAISFVRWLYAITSFCARYFVHYRLRNSAIKLAGKHVFLAVSVILRS